MSSDISAEAERAERQAHGQQNEEGDGQQHEQPDHQQQHEHTEQTPLLQNQNRNENQQPENEGDLDSLITYYSDQSAKVRVVRWVLYLFTAFFVIWELLLVANIFVSVGAVQSRGSNFFEVDLVFLTLVNTILTLYFYTVPTYGDFLLGCLGLALLVVDAIVLWSVPILRHRHAAPSGLVTMITAGVAFGMCILGRLLVIDLHRHAMASGETTGRKLKRWFQISVSFLLHMAVVAGVTMLTILLFVRLATTIRNGPTTPRKLTMIDGSDFGVFINCTALPADSSTTIIVESGNNARSSDFASWIVEHDTEKYQVCYWDRPGLGESDSAPSPQSAGSVADSLTQALRRQPEALGSEYVLVSHGSGGLFSRVFASRHASKVTTLMFVESTHEDLYFGSLTAWYGFKSWLKGVVSPVSHGRKQRYRIQEQFAKHMSRLELKAADNIIDPQTRLVVVSSAREIDRSKRWGEAQRRLTKLTKRNIAWEIVDGPHQLWRDTQARRKLQALLNNVLAFSE